ncbi:Major Facilitator Superfamily protein [Bosea sp. LC85]|uniref:MFS transporter n=1 Tax=Bosea sp. LC85 TaxID=1502851 RepID=UPI0004E41A92|nr:MFS transporter [Bosea sp. LC85]KFC69299.1 Major Facilitator Superfamily protein [Bosea sp. LC85]
MAKLKPGTSSTALLVRWFISSATLTVPQAAGPVAFALVALALTGDTSGGAAMILAMTLAQVIGAIPITRAGARFPVTTFLRLLVVFRTIALASIAVLAHYSAAFGWLIAFSALAGAVNGAAFGYLRTVLNALAPASKLPRALGISATLNEVTFVLAPVAASGLGSVSPVFAVLVVAALGAIPALLVPTTASVAPEEAHHPDASVISPAILLWLICAAAGGSTVAALEIGAVALAVHFGYEPTLAILFTVPLCLASVASGVWVSVRNRMQTRRAVLIQLTVMTLGSIIVALQISMAVTVLGAVLVGAVLAPLGTYYSLALDALAPPKKRPEVFALLRTANATGVIVASAVMTAVSLSTALIVVSCLMITVVVVVGLSRKA